MPRSSTGRRHTRTRIVKPDDRRAGGYGSHDRKECHTHEYTTNVGAVDAKHFTAV